jgi:hypothetical protein
MLSAIKQTGTVAAVMGVEDAFRQFGLDLGQCLDYRLPGGFKISLDPTRQTLTWPVRAGLNIPEDFIDRGWLIVYWAGNRIFELRYRSANRQGIVALAETYGTSEVIAHIGAALAQFGIC